MYRSLDHLALWRHLRRHLAVNGATPAGELYALLGVSAATLSRLLSAHRSEVCSSGRGRAIRYAIRRLVNGENLDFPIFEVHTDGTTTRVAAMYPIEPAGFIVEGIPALTGIYPGLPWFIDDLRPSGFLGRLVPSQHPEFAYPRDIRSWSIDQSVLYLATHGSDLVGNLIVGNSSFQAFLASTPANPVHTDSRAVEYPRLATNVMSLGVPGSSAAGEQPKFLATLREADVPRTPVLVKFSPPMRSDFAVRTADLLVCEHVAMRTAEAHGLATAHTEVMRFADRTFLEVHRFDRSHEQGRRGLVSLRSLDGEYVGEGQNWTVVAEALRAQGRIQDRCLQRVVWLERFGSWIGNTDRHLGNLSFFFESGKIGELAPLYDMLPMCYAPRSGEVIDANLSLPVLRPQYPEEWISSWRAGTAFWKAIARHELISPQFRALAEQNACLLLAQEPSLRRLPGIREP